MANFRLKQAIKAAKLPAIIGVVLFVVGVVLAIVGIFCSMVLLFIGVIVFLGGLLSCVFAYANAKERMDAICPTCQKYMGDTDQDVEYGFTLVQSEDCFNKDGKYTGTKFSYDCVISCPHCGNTTMFSHAVNDKDAANANVKIDKYLKNILNLKNLDDKKKDKGDKK